MSALKFWLWLSTKQRLDAETAAALVDALGSPETVYYADEEELKSHLPLSSQHLEALADKSMDRAGRILEQCQLTGTKLMTMQDAAYPERLRALRLPPIVLYYRGRLPAMDEEAAIAIVGTRKPTAYGVNTALRLGYQLAENGMLVVSGMASGIDGQAQIGALRAGKPTIAVLGNGPDIVYPAEHRQLYEDIVALGAVVSEYPPGTKGDRRSFPQRNRIISGLSLGTVIVEAPRGSGALITANHALEQGRDVFAVPGPIDSRESTGCHRLIREGAILLSHMEDVLDEYRAVYPHKITRTAGEDQPPGVPQMPRPTAEPTPKASAEPPPLRDISARISVYDREQQMILYAIAGEPRNADAIMELTGLHAEIVLSELSVLELEGIIQKKPGGRFILTLED